MKKIYIILVSVLAFFSCTKVNYPQGYDNIYYVSWDYDSTQGQMQMRNMTIKTSADEGALVALDVKLFSEIERDYDVEARIYMRSTPYFIKASSQAAIQEEAVPGLDFILYDEDMTPLTHNMDVDTLQYYKVVFPKAKKGVKHLYLKPLPYGASASARVVIFSLAQIPLNTETTESVRQSAINVVTDDYILNTIHNSYVRRIEIK